MPKEQAWVAQTPSGMNKERYRNLLINLEISMADITNRSRFRVTVRNRDVLTAHFPFHKLNSVKACV